MSHANLNPRLAPPPPPHPPPPRVSIAILFHPSCHPPEAAPASPRDAAAATSLLECTRCPAHTSFALALTSRLTPPLVATCAGLLTRDRYSDSGGGGDHDHVRAQLRCLLRRLKTTLLLLALTPRAVRNLRSTWQRRKPRGQHEFRRKLILRCGRCLVSSVIWPGFFSDPIHSRSCFWQKNTPVDCNRN
jgi:hypothetical protein